MFGIGVHGGGSGSCRVRRGLSRGLSARSCQRTQHAQRGLSVLGVMLGMVVAAIFMLVVLKAFQDATDRQRADAAVAESTLLLAAVQKIYREDYTQLSTESVVLSGIVPRRMLAGEVGGGAGAAPSVRNTYGQSVVFMPSPDAGGLMLGRMVYPVGRENCAELAVMLDAMAYAIRVDGEVVKDRGLGLDMVQVANSCKASDRAGSGQFAQLAVDFGAAGL